jgi:regulation of enolase protein 1 (concanavalin A-like superfamily)
MGRSLIVGLLATSILAAPVPKENDEARMKRLYGTPHDPEADCTFTPSGESLRITVPPNLRLLNPRYNLSAPRVWREVHGDFTATVRVSFTIRKPGPPQHEEATEIYAGGGLVVWADSENFLTLTRDENGGEPGEQFRVAINEQGKASGDAYGSETAGSGYLRLQRKGTELFASYSTDGKTWEKKWSYDPDWPDALMIGVFAENSFGVPFEAVFDEYALTVPVPTESEARMKRAYGTVRDPDKGTEFTLVGDTLRLIVSKEPRLLGRSSGLYNAPRVSRVVRGDFTATVRASFPVRKSAPKHEGMTEGLTGGGILAWINRENYVLITREDRGSGEPEEWFRGDVYRGGGINGWAHATKAAGSGYLRLQRKEKELIASYSTDGKTWKGNWSYDVDWPDELKVGVVAENSSGVPFEIAFDDYTLTVTK